MAGNADNARQWADADVYVSFELDAATPANVDTAFSADWHLIGLLDGDEGFTETRDEDSTDHFAWGGLLIRTSRRNFMMSRSFTALEASRDVVDRLRYPGSTNTSIVVPSGNQIEKVLIAFEAIDRDIKRRVISANYAEITVDGDVTENESDISSIPFMAKIFPTSAGVLFTRQTDETLSS